MRRGWRSSAPCAGWRSRWPMTDPPRLRADATAAFVDRAPIDWPALLSRVRTPRERAFFENLRLVAAVREANRRETVRRAPSPAARTAAWSLVAVAAVQFAGSLAVLLLAVASGVPVAGRTEQL